MLIKVMVIKEKYFMHPVPSCIKRLFATEIIYMK